MVTLNEKIYLDNLFLDLSVNTTAEMMKSRLEGAMGPSVGSITVSTTGTCHGQSWHLTFKTVGGDILPLEVICSLTPAFLLFRMKAGANQANIKWRQRFFLPQMSPCCRKKFSMLATLVNVVGHFYKLFRICYPAKIYGQKLFSILEA